MAGDYKNIRVRFAPSPTGHLHIGGVRTCLYNYLFARSVNGKFILRIEDTDQKRLMKEAESELISGLRYLGIKWDEGPDIGGSYGPYRQSERKEIYQQFSKRLIETGHAYYCFCSPERLENIRKAKQERNENTHYDGRCRDISLGEAEQRISAGEPYVVRFKSPRQGTTTVVDLLRGSITIENKNLDDYILVKSDGLALYHLAAMVDDHLMDISHVIRGAEWLPSLPLHALIIRALGWKEPTWVHLSLFLKPNGKGKMSKREATDLSGQGYSIFVSDLIKLGFIPEGIINWVALMGWSYDDHTELFDISELISKFSLNRLNPAPSAMNFSKLDYFNRKHICRIPPPKLAPQLKPFFENLGYKTNEAVLERISPLLCNHITTLDEAPQFAGFFFRDEIVTTKDDLGENGLTVGQSIEILHQVYKLIKSIGCVTKENLEPAIRELISKSGFTASQFLGIIRVAITGQKISTPLFETMEIIGLDKVLTRLQTAKHILDSQPDAI